MSTAVIPASLMGHVAQRIESPAFGERVVGHQYDALARLKQTKIDVASTRTFSSVDVKTAAQDEGFDPLPSADATVVHSHGDADTLQSTTPDHLGRRFDASYDQTSTAVPPTSVNGLTVSRDARDRISSDEKLKYVFDAFDRLVLVQRDGVDELRLAYDGVGRRRLERRGKAPANSDDVVLEYDRGNVIQETAAKTGAIAFSTIHAPALDAPVVSWFGQLQPSTTVYDLGTDVRGDVTIAFKNGAAHEEQLLSAYGEREAFDANGNGCVEGLDAGSRSLPVAGCTTLTVLQRFGIGGARQHAATKLVDLRNRVYAPHLRGFLTKDPLGAVDSDSLFAYVAADPVNLRDPWGLAVTEDSPPSSSHNFDPAEVKAPRKTSHNFDPHEVEATVSSCDATCQFLRAGRELGGLLKSLGDGGALGDAGADLVPGGDDFGAGVTKEIVRHTLRQTVTVGLAPVVAPLKIGGTALSDPRDNLSELVNGLPGVSNYFTTRDVIDACASNPGSAACGGAAVRAIEMITDLVVGARKGGAGCPGGRCGPGRRSCFEAGTLVLTPDGAIPIEEVVVGMLVLSRDPETGAWDWRPVTRKFVRPVEGVLTLELATDLGDIETLHVTPEHPFMTASGAFVEAGDLVPGDVVDTMLGDARVQRLSWIDGERLVYNFEVDGTHTYFVGELGAWVHNTCWKPGKNDLDWRGSGRGQRDAVAEGFNRTGEPRSNFEVTKWGKDEHGKSFPVEWRSSSGAEVNIDMGHLNNGPGTPHVGWQTGGKRGAGGAARGHILVDDVTVNR